MKTQVYLYTEKKWLLKETFTFWNFSQISSHFTYSISPHPHTIFSGSSSLNPQAHRRGLTFADPPEAWPSPWHNLSSLPLTLYPTISVRGAAGTASSSWELLETSGNLLIPGLLTFLFPGATICLQLNNTLWGTRSTQAQLSLLCSWRRWTQPHTPTGSQTHQPDALPAPLLHPVEER